MLPGSWSTWIEPCPSQVREFRAQRQNPVCLVFACHQPSPLCCTSLHRCCCICVPLNGILTFAAVTPGMGWRAFVNRESPNLETVGIEGMTIRFRQGQGLTPHPMLLGACDVWECRNHGRGWNPVFCTSAQAEPEAKLMRERIEELCVRSSSAAGTPRRRCTMRSAGTMRYSSKEPQTRGCVAGGGAWAGRSVFASPAALSCGTFAERRPSVKEEGGRGIGV